MCGPSVLQGVCELWSVNTDTREQEWCLGCIYLLLLIRSHGKASKAWLAAYKDCVLVEKRRRGSGGWEAFARTYVGFFSFSRSDND